MLLLALAAVTAAAAMSPAQTGGGEGASAVDFRVLATGARGVIVQATLSDGRSGIFSARDRRLSPIWVDRATQQDEVYLWGNVVAARNGTAVVPTHSSGSPLPRFLVIVPGRTPRFVNPPTTLGDGRPICTAQVHAVDPRGHFALRVEDCSFPANQRQHALYLAGDRQPNLLIESRPPPFEPEPNRFLDPERFRILALQDDGTVIVEAWILDVAGRRFATEILALGRDDSVRSLLEQWTSSPAEEGPTVEHVAANRHGKVAFIPVDEPYQQHDHLPHLLQHGRVESFAIDPVQIDDIWSGVGFALTPSAEIVLSDVGPPSDTSPLGTIYLLATDGALENVFAGVTDIAADYVTRANNDIALGEDGSVVFSVTSEDPRRHRRVISWSESVVTTVLEAGDPVIDPSEGGGDGCHLDNPGGRRSASHPVGLLALLLALAARGRSRPG